MEGEHYTHTMQQLLWVWSFTLNSPFQYNGHCVEKSEWHFSYNKQFICLWMTISAVFVHRNMSAWRPSAPRFFLLYCPTVCRDYLYYLWLHPLMGFVLPEIARVETDVRIYPLKGKGDLYKYKVLHATRTKLHNEVVYTWRMKPMVYCSVISITRALFEVWVKPSMQLQNFFVSFQKFQSRQTNMQWSLFFAIHSL